MRIEIYRVEDFPMAGVEGWGTFEEQAEWEAVHNDGAYLTRVEFARDDRTGIVFSQVIAFCND